MSHVSFGTLEKDVAIIAAALKWAGVIATTFISTTVAFGTYVVLTLHQQDTSIVVQQMQLDNVKERIYKLEHTKGD